MIIHIKNASKSADIYSDSFIIDCINEAEQSIWANVIKEFKSDAIPLVANTKEYALPDDCHFEDIEKVFHGETREFEYSLSKLDYINKYSYFKNDDKICISPKPTEAGFIEIIWRKRPAIKELDSEELSLPEMFTDVYRYFILYSIHTLQQEIDIANMFLTQYNNRLAAVRDWWNKTI